jgi:hypothetical protein
MIYLKLNLFLYIDVNVQQKDKKISYMKLINNKQMLFLLYVLFFRIYNNFKKKYIL